MLPPPPYHFLYFNDQRKAQRLELKARGCHFSAAFLFQFWGGGGGKRGMVWVIVSTFGRKFPGLENKILELYKENNYLPPLFTKTWSLLWHTLTQRLYVFGGLTPLARVGLRRDVSFCFLLSGELFSNLAVFVANSFGQRHWWNGVDIHSGNPSSFVNLHKGNALLPGLWDVERPFLFGIIHGLSIMWQQQ